MWVNGFVIEENQVLPDAFQISTILYSQHDLYDEYQTLLSQM